MSADEPVKVAWAEDEFKAQLIQGLLEDRGIPSIQQQLGLSGRQLGSGWPNPSGGDRNILVPAERAEEARALLDETFAESQEPEEQRE
jgi:hypothetical protein